MKWRLTSRLGRGRIRTTTSSRVSMEMLQPWVQPGQTLAVLSRSQARALCRKSFDRSEPTGQRSTTLPAHASGAEDAAVGDVEDVRAEVLDRVVALGELRVPGARPPFLEDVVLQLAL